MIEDVDVADKDVKNSGSLVNYRWIRPGFEAQQWKKLISNFSVNYFTNCKVTRNVEVKRKVSPII